jgi:hypothetical protein
LANGPYATLLSQVESLVKHKRSLLVASSGPLTALPFHPLVMKKPPADVNGLAERSLVLNISKRASELDDGLLTRGEVAQLRLNAECCPPATPSPVTGLARSFFCAGARALLVSH